MSQYGTGESGSRFGQLEFGGICGITGLFDEFGDRAPSLSGEGAEFRGEETGLRGLLPFNTKDGVHPAAQNVLFPVHGPSVLNLSSL